MKKAIVLLSGGLDSTTCMSVAKEKGYELYPISFNYGQKHSMELGLAKKIAKVFNSNEHKIIKIDGVGGSALTDEGIDIPKYSESDEVPITYVPARNLLFLSYALGYAEAIGAETIFIGISSVDYSGYPDCRPEFLKAFEDMIKVATVAGLEGKPIKVEAPLMNLTKAETIKLGISLKTPYEMTTSCYRGDKKACGVCDSCTLRKKGFFEANIEDPIEYE